MTTSKLCDWFEYGSTACVGDGDSCFGATDRKEKSVKSSGSTDRHYGPNGQLFSLSKYFLG